MLEVVPEVDTHIFTWVQRRGRKTVSQNNRQCKLKTEMPLVLKDNNRESQCPKHTVFKTQYAHSKLSSC